MNVKNDEPAVAIGKGLAKLGEDLKADRVNVMEGEKHLVRNSFCWTRPGIVSAKDRQQKLSSRKLSKGLAELVEEDSLFLQDPAKIKQLFPEVVATYEEGYLLENVLLAPFYERGRIRGAVVAENLDPDLNMDLYNLIELTADFVGAKVIGHKLEQQRDTDVLTKLNDRHPYLTKLTYYQTAQESKTVGVAFMDLNGLKETNDELGHDAGDELLIAAGQLISQAFGHEYIYRVGGDEFVVLDDQSTKAEFATKCAAFKKLLQEPEAPSISLGTAWCTDSHRLLEAVERADIKMRRKKADFYKSHKRYR